MLLQKRNEATIIFYAYGKGTFFVSMAWLPSGIDTYAKWLPLFFWDILLIEISPNKDRYPHKVAVYFNWLRKAAICLVCFNNEWYAFGIVEFVQPFFRLQPDYRLYTWSENKKMSIFESLS